MSLLDSVGFKFSIKFGVNFMITTQIKGDAIKMAEQFAVTGNGTVVLCHGLNCSSGLDGYGGFAGKLKEHYGEFVEADKLTHQLDINKLGDIVALAVNVKCESEDFYLNKKFHIVNMYTQFRGGRDINGHSVDYKAIAKAFASLNAKYKGREALILIPEIGAGIGGGHWQAIKTIIDLVTPDICITAVSFAPTKEESEIE